MLIKVMAKLSGVERCDAKVVLGRVEKRGVAHWQSGVESSGVLCSDGDAR